MAGSAMPTTVASIEASADPSTVASSTHRPGPLAYRRLPGWLEVASGVPNAPTSPLPPWAAGGLMPCGRRRGPHRRSSLPPTAGLPPTLGALAFAVLCHPTDGVIRPL